MCMWGSGSRVSITQSHQNTKISHSGCESSMTLWGMLDPRWHKIGAGAQRDIKQICGFFTKPSGPMENLTTPLEQQYQLCPKTHEKRTWNKCMQEFLIFLDAYMDIWMHGCMDGLKRGWETQGHRSRCYVNRKIKHFFFFLLPVFVAAKPFHSH